MFQRLAVVLVLSSAGAVHAQSCEELGLKSAFLTNHFCTQLQELAPSDATRSVTGSIDAPSGVPDLPNWAEVEVIQDAYRADPRKTLELIKRIKSAGGLPDS
ncbi:MAG: hypothetical protein AAGA08_00975 [Pseudomonadota bacterium]